MARQEPSAKSSVGHDVPRPWTQTHPGTITVFLLSGAVIVGAGIRFASPVLAPMLLGGLVTIVSAPLVGWLRKHRVPRVASVAIAVLGDTAVLAAIGWLLGRSAGRLSSKLPEYVALLTESQAAITARLHKLSPGLTLPDVLHPETVASWTTSLLGNFANLIWNIGFALLLAAFLLYEISRPGRPQAGSSHLDNVRRAVREVNKYIAVKTVVSMATGCLIGLWLIVCDADLPVLFGLLAFVLNYIPNIGSILAAIPAVGLAGLQGGVGQATLVTSGYVVINVIIGNLVEPRVMGRVLGLSPVVVLISVVVWGWLLGPVGALLSALLTVLLKLGLSSTEDLRPYALLLGPVPPRAPYVFPAPEAEEDLTEVVVPQSRQEGGEDLASPDQNERNTEVSG